MMVLISYDVATTDGSGSRRLRRVAKVCKNYGQRVQYSVFECIVDPAQWTMLKQRLEDEIDPDQVKAKLKRGMLRIEFKKKPGKEVKVEE